MPLLPLCLLLALSQSAAPAFEAPFKALDDAMTVDAVVNGAPVTLLLDTGFSGAIILRDGIDVGKPSGERMLRDFVGKFKATTVPLRSLTVEGHSLKPDDAEIIQQPANNMSAAYHTHIDGLIGLGALHAQVFEIDFQNNKLRFFPPSESLANRTPPPGVIASNLLPIGHSSLQLPVVTASGQKLTMGLDTGNAFYATTHRDVLERVGLWSPTANPKYMRISGVASGSVNSWSARVKNFTIFGIKAPVSVWDVIDLPSSAAEADGTIGYQFLRNFNITVDFASRIVWLQNYNGKVTNEAEGEVGLVAAFSPTLRRMTILDVSPESPAAVAGVQNGDEIISLNGRDMVHESYEQMRKLFQGPVDSIVNLAVSRNGNLMRFQLKRKALVNDVGPLDF